MDDAYRDTVETLGAALTSIKEALLVLDNRVSELTEMYEKLREEVQELRRKDIGRK